jgi:cystathionine beta-lyase/cystathionine gamma-synthase
MKFSTKAIHIGNEPDALTGAVMPPIYMTSTFALNSPGHSKGFEYTRVSNPNFVILEKTLASLEDAPYATVFSSGIGALTALVSTLSQGDKVVAIDGVYGGTYRLFTQILSRFGIDFIVILSVSESEIEKTLAYSKPKWVMFETPTNPLMNIFDIELISKLAKKHGALTVVDNTFASPYCQNPLKWGADIVWHSTTKYIGGHSDVLGGVVMSHSQELQQKLIFARKTWGVNPSPFDCWLITRGVKTLALRMEQHQKNALKVAAFLEKHPKVKRVYYPGLPSHPSHDLAKKQMRCFNGMLSAEFNLPLDQTLQMVSSFQLFTLAESLGGVESLVSHPATMTHAIVPKEERDQLGITDGLIRFSIGIEDSDDLIADLESSLSKFD